MLFSWPTWQSDRRPSDAGSLASRCSPTLTKVDDTLQSSASRVADCHVSFSC